MIQYFIVVFCFFTYYLFKILTEINHRWRSKSVVAELLPTADLERSSLQSLAIDSLSVSVSSVPAHQPFFRRWITECKCRREIFDYPRRPSIDSSYTWVPGTLALSLSNDGSAKSDCCLVLDFGRSSTGLPLLLITAASLFRFASFYKG